MDNKTPKSKKARNHNQWQLSNNVEKNTVRKPKSDQEINLEEKYLCEESCELCSLKFNNIKAYQRHGWSDEHCFRVKYRLNKKDLKVGVQNIKIDEKNGVKGSEIINISVDAASDGQINLILSNTSNISYSVTNIVLLYTKLKNLVFDYKLPIKLNGYKFDSIRIQFCFYDEGTYLLPLLFVAKAEDVHSKLQTQRTLKEILIKVRRPAKYFNNIDVKNNNRAVLSYSKKTHRLFELDHLKIINGMKPPNHSTDGLQLVRMLGYFELPQFIIEFLNNGLQSNGLSKREQIAIQRILKLLKGKNSVNQTTYCDTLKLLLQFEEVALKNSIREFDCEDQTLSRIPGIPDLLSLNVPGLAEDRPSLIKGDNLVVFEADAMLAYKGYIHHVEATTLQIGFHCNFVCHEYHENKRYNVTFGFNRHTLRTEHQAVELVKEHRVERFFFPTTIPQNPPISKIPFCWFESKIQTNEEQQQAVKHIVAETSAPYPYLLFGPPGTGKTLTIVEAILQLWKQKPYSRILVAAPSNSAANEITRRLIHHRVPQKDLFRMISVSFEPRNIPDDLKTYSNYKDKEFFFPAIKVLESYRILVVTLTAAAKLVFGGVTPGRFQYIFIDESGHCTEPQVLIPLAGIITNENSSRLLGKIILAGDPEQLGPIIHSKLALQQGLNTSMLERLMKSCDLYKKNAEGIYNPKMVTKLLKNFRSHETILKLPNDMFYDSELQAKGSAVVNDALGWDSLPNKKFPMIFHNVKGTCSQDPDSPSYYNFDEVKVVMEYLDKLVSKTLNNKLIRQKDIGIVTPYKKQVQKLLTACRGRKWNDIMVGSVEQFQGQERMIIIASTVRSAVGKMKHEYQSHLGFLKNPKRFNVTITRAKALVIVIGNPDILCWDAHWGQFINYCKINKALAGAEFEFTPSWMNTSHRRSPRRSISVSSNGTSSPDVSNCWNKKNP